MLAVAFLAFLFRVPERPRCVIWGFISGIFPNAVRAQGQALGFGTHWVLATVIALTFPIFAEKPGGGNPFAFFAGLMMPIPPLFFVRRFMPETKGPGLERLDRPLVLH